MSLPSEARRISVPEIKARKGREPIVSLTCYHAHTAKLLDRYIDIMLVGDSLGMVMHGMETTLGVSLELMILHAQAVMRGAKHALVVVDMPFGTYEESPEMAFRNAARVMKETGCSAVKLEGGARMAATVRYLTLRGIPVMAHIGMSAQMVKFSAASRRGPDGGGMALLQADAVAIAEAGAFAVVLEAMAEPLAAKITQMIPIPTIGIGASPACDGQILVMEDMLGLNPNPPRFVREYAHLGRDIEAAVKAYAADVRSRHFPSQENVYTMTKGSTAV